MIFTDETINYLLLLQTKVRAALAESKSDTPFFYEDEPFHRAYEALFQIWKMRRSQRQIAVELSISRSTIKKWEHDFTTFGTIGLLANLSFVDIDPMLERLVILIKSARPHENSSLCLKLASALKIKGATLANIRLIQRCYGYGQRFNEKDVRFFTDFQNLLNSVERLKATRKISGHEVKNRHHTFIDFDRDPFQQKIELFKILSHCEKKRKVRPILQQFGIHPNRYYELKNRFMLYGVWGLVDLATKQRVGEKTSPNWNLELLKNG